MSAKTIYFVAGEASADNHGAALMRALRSADVDLRFIGRGGPQMKAVAGTNFQNWIDKSSVLGLWEVIKHYGYFRKQFHATLREIEKSSRMRSCLSIIRDSICASPAHCGTRRRRRKSFITSAHRCGRGTAAASKKWRAGSI